MVKSKLRMYAVVFALALSASAVTVSATGLNSVEVPEGNTAVQQETQNNTGNGLVGYNASVNDVLDAMGESTGKYMNGESLEFGRKTSDALAKPVGYAIQLFLGAFVGIYSLHTVVDLFAMLTQFIKELLGVQQGQSSGMAGDGSGKKKKIQWVSDDYLKAVAEAGGGKSGSGLDGAGSQQSGNGVISKNVFLLYLKIRGINAIIAATVSIILLTPVGWNLIMVISTFIIRLFEILTVKLQGVTSSWLTALSQNG